MEEQSKKYLLLTLGVILTLSSALAAFNYTIDPYGIYRAWGPNDVYPAADTYERIHKTERIKRVKPDVLILGTSRANIGVNPRQAFFPGLTPYNGAVSAATIYEQRKMLEMAHKSHPLKKVIMALDFMVFNTARLENRHFEEKRVADDALSPVNSFIHTYGTIVSFSTILVSLKHLRYKKTVFRRSHPEANGHKKHNEGAWRAKKFGVHSIFMLSPNAEIAGNSFSYKYSDKPEDDSFQHFRAMLDFCLKSGIEAYIYIGPLHKTHLQMYKDNNMWETMQDWKKMIAEIAAPYPYPLWDFSTYNSLTTEPLPPVEDKETQMKWFWDTDHYKEETGDIILQKILGLKGKDYYPDFGKKIN